MGHVGLSPVLAAAMRKRILRRIVEEEGDTLRRLHVETPDLLERLGLSRELLKEAIRLSRMTHVNEGTECVNFTIATPVAVQGYLLAAGKKNGFPVGDFSTFFRSLLHAVMQTSFEPKARGHQRVNRATLALDPHPRGDRLRPLSPDDIGRKDNQRKPCGYRKVRISVGLRDAIRARARCYGLGSTIYCLQWLLDAIDQILPEELIIEPVRFKELFPRAENYVLPVRKPLPETLLADSVTIEGDAP